MTWIESQKKLAAEILSARTPGTEVYQPFPGQWIVRPIGLPIVRNAPAPLASGEADVSALLSVAAPISAPSPPTSPLPSLLSTPGSLSTEINPDPEKYADVRSRKESVESEDGRRDGGKTGKGWRTWDKGPKLPKAQKPKAKKRRKKR